MSRLPETICRDIRRHALEVALRIDTTKDANALVTTASVIEQYIVSGSADTRHNQPELNQTPPRGLCLDISKEELRVLMADASSRARLALLGDEDPTEHVERLCELANIQTAHEIGPVAGRTP